MTEIYGTLGPACREAETLCAMAEQGMTGIRLNLSHVSLREARPMLDALREAEKRCGRQIRLLVDMQGPELRVGALPEPLSLPEGECVALDALRLPAVVLERIRPGQELLLDDGKLLLRALSGERAQVLRGGVLRSRKSLALPGLEIRLPALTAQDRENIALARETGVNGVMQPFVRDREDLLELRRALKDAGAGDVRIFAKIENRAGLEGLEELIAAADEIVIARGDLGNAMPLWELPAAQKNIAAACRRAGRPFMVVTQMLSSMEQNPVPTRAEVSDIFNAVLDGAASVMVTGETASGRYPAEVIRYLCSTARQAERWMEKQKKTEL